ncbi:hypothetical protein EDE04_1169 [Streptomyces sp. 2132.2]|uniref:hypothetical protein n=1 Tax=Streptomyces sp. 2132.2 TaxID=2485161 RepID=UPI000F473E07|nr:hypothetical protein [Streptomyces sp. 2132.2]ROQ94737.1 hypothetical protein EDE04_1169 [Streptomyces sp. 2132.2]
MGAIRSNATALLSAGATCAVLALGAVGAPSATAAEPVTPFAVAITPSQVAPGGQAVVSAPGCNVAEATVSSGVFDTVVIGRGKTARVTVDSDARRGAVYSVTFTCNGVNRSADLTITGGATKPTTSSTSTSTAASAASRGASLGVRGGLGGSVAGMDPRELGAGAALFLAAAGGTAYVLRRRAATRGH